eukprot:TRINITY_DN1721_c0_g1_i4.p1 TRINITY_DN1721_c0_g1~~TRINITY_DN1721_c0_g1_i4.p1  ORF type:complete len:736 (-),score=222.23 TRINITY_DN1721_c0_g1_i4:131-2293(-)
MSKRQNNQLPNNLPQLQNLIKRDPASYKEEFLQQFRHFQSTLEVFELTPDKFNTSLDELVMFLAQVAKCYSEELKEFPETIVDALKKHSTVIDADMRLSFCRALILLRNKNLISPAEIHQLFFQLLRCQDKSLRTFLKDNIINDIKNINAKHKDMKLNTTLQNFMYSMLRDSHAIAAKTSLEVMVALYKKNVWRDEKTVNVMATACFSKVTKVMVTALKFFLGSDEEEDDNESDNEDELPSLKSVALANRMNKKSKKREKVLENLKKAHIKKKKKDKAPSFNFSALHLIHDPQDLAEKLFKKLESLTEKFEVKLMMLELVSRLIGTHELQLLNFYPYIARFLAPHQREVIRLLQFSAQSCHELVPPDAVEPVLKAIVNNFVTERNSSEVMAIGLNAIRELCARCPLVMSEELLRDLAEYKTYKDKAVMMASKSLIMLFRNTYPELLHKKDRGRPTEAMASLGRKGYGESDVFDHVPGAEVLNVDAPTEPAASDGAKESANNGGKATNRRGQKRKLDPSEEPDDSDGWESDSSGGTWVEVAHSDSEDEIDGEDGDGECKGDAVTLEEKAAKAQEVTVGRILTDEDFKRIDAAQLKKQVTGVRKNSKKQKIGESAVDPGANHQAARQELVHLDNIELIHGKKKNDKAARMASIMAGREDREKFGRGRMKKDEYASKSNKQKEKKKNFSMMKHKIKKKVKRSFRDKQLDLKKRLMKQRKFSKM